MGRHIGKRLVAEMILERDFNDHLSISADQAL